MIRIAKYLFYIVIGLGIIFLIWFLPKYSYVKENPGYCANLTTNLYYCGTESNLKEVFESNLDTKTNAEQSQLEDKVKSGLQAELNSQLKTQINNQLSN